MYDWDLPSPDLALQESEVIGSKLQNERIAANVRSTTLATTVRKRDNANFASLRVHLQIHHASSVHATLQEASSYTYILNHVCANSK